jgi:membrane peptidoglycan carboxypeptidase
MGYDDNTPLKGVTGGGLPADIWRTAMEEIHSKLTPIPLLADRQNRSSGKSIATSVGETSSLGAILGKFFNNLFKSN